MGACMPSVLARGVTESIMKKNTHSGGVRRKKTRKTLVPDYMFTKFDDIGVDFLRSAGILSLIIDIDNTLAPYEVAEPDERTFRWFESLAGAGIGAALVSNNDRERVERYNSRLALPAYYDCHKPSRKYLIKAMADIGASPESTLFLGDQIFTDVVAARRMGLRAAVVPPIKDKKTVFFKFKRLMERPIMRRYHRRAARREAEKYGS